MIIDTEKLHALIAQGLSTRQIGQALGVGKTTAARLVKKHAAGQALRLAPRHSLDPESELGRKLAELVGKASDRAIALELGISRNQVRGFRERRKIPGWVREKPVERKKPKLPESRFIAANDQEAIAQFIAERGVTVLPPGTACGLSAIERQLYAAKPPTKDYTAWVERRQAKGRR